MSGFPTAKVLLNRSKNRDIYANGFSSSGPDVYITTHFLFFLSFLFGSNSLQPLQVEHADFFLLLPGSNQCLFHCFHFNVVKGDTASGAWCMFADIWLPAFLQRKGPTDAISSLYNRIWESDTNRSHGCNKGFSEKWVLLVMQRWTLQQRLGLLLH